MIAKLVELRKKWKQLEGESQEAADAAAASGDYSGEDCLGTEARLYRAILTDTEPWVTAEFRGFLVAADSELSAIAHGRPPSDQSELIRISLGLRSMYEAKERLL